MGGNVMFFSKVELIPHNGNGESIIKDFSEDPGILKKVEFLDGQIIVSRICPHGHHKPRKFRASDYHVSGIACASPEGE